MLIRRLIHLPRARRAREEAQQAHDEACRRGDTRAMHYTRQRLTAALHEVMRLEGRGG